MTRSWKIYRNRRGSPRWFQRLLEASWILTGRYSLHRVWQEGYDEHERHTAAIAMREYRARLS